MNILDNLIEFENENTSLDFKLEEYTKYKTISLIKDIMSMANADLKDDRYIIIGMKPDQVGRNIVGIDTLIDSASIQQTIVDNIAYSGESLPAFRDETLPGIPEQSLPALAGIAHLRCVRNNIQ